MNQCDGCRRGLVLNLAGNHIDPVTKLPVQGCTAKLYGKTLDGVRDGPTRCPNCLQENLEFIHGRENELLDDGEVHRCPEPNTNADEFQCEACHSTFNNDHSLKVGDQYICEWCATETEQCPECARSFGPHYTGPCEH